MITPKELLAKTDKAFFKIVSSQLKGESVFPWVIPSNKQILGSNYSDWKNDIVPLYQQSKSVKSKSYTVEWKEKIINGSKQSIPSKIYFENFDDYLAFTGRTNDYGKILAANSLIIFHFPGLKNWAAENTRTLLQYDKAWDDLLKVCTFFVSHPPPYPYYIREIPVEVHSKFIEKHAGILKTMLDILLPADHINDNETDFAGRYFLKKPAVFTQIRILDDSLKPYLGYDEISLSLDDASWLKWMPEKVFIIENKTCFLTFPKIKNAVAIFGEGFKSNISKQIPWLKQTRLFCWFDLDAAGFEMLNMIRQYYTDVRSFLMDRDTYCQFEQYAVSNTSKEKSLPNLSTEEIQLYQFLLTNKKRLEQERIVQEYVQNKLNELR